LYFDHDLYQTESESDTLIRNVNTLCYIISTVLLCYTFPLASTQTSTSGHVTIFNSHVRLSTLNHYGFLL